MTWNVVIHPKAVSEINDLPADMRAKLLRIIELMQATSPFDVAEPHVKSLGNKLMEIRLKGKSGISRVIYVLLTGKKIALLHAFIKKTQKTPHAALECALRRLTEVSDD